MAEKKDCFIKGKIYIGVAEPLPSGTYSYNHAIPKWEEKIKGLTSYPVIGTHSFKDGQEVTGLYDLKRKGNMSGGQAVLTTVHDADFKPENIVAISSNGTTHNLNILTMGNTKQIKTAKEIILQFANEHSYESWGELMYDTHEPVQVDYTKQVMELYHAQFQHPVPDASHPAGNDAVKFWEWVKKQIEICDSEELNAKFLIMHDTKSVREYWKGKRDALKEIKSWQP